MLFHDAMERFIQRSPFTVMVRCTLENLLRPQNLDAMFDDTAEQQYTRKILFSSLVDLMGLVVCKIRPSMRAAYLAHEDRIAGTLKSAYAELSHGEPGVAAETIRRSYRDAAAV